MDLIHGHTPLCPGACWRRWASRRKWPNPQLLSPFFHTDPHPLPWAAPMPREGMDAIGEGSPTAGSTAAARFVQVYEMYPAFNVFPACGPMQHSCHVSGRPLWFSPVGMFRLICFIE